MYACLSFTYRDDNYGRVLTFMHRRQAEAKKEADLLKAKADAVSCT